MIDPTLLASAISQKNPSGMPAFTKAQIADIAIKEDSHIGRRIRRAMDLGVTKEQAIKFLAYGSSNGPVEVPQPKPSFFSRFAQTVSDYATAPGNALAGAIEKPLAKAMGKEPTPNAQNLPENLKKSADLARVAIPVAAGIATGGASIPVSAAIAGGAGAGSSLLASGLEAAAGEEQTAGGAIGEALTMGAGNAALDAATMGLFRLARPLLKTKGAAQLSDDASKTTGKIVQGTADDIKAGRQALQSIESEGVQTYADLQQKIAGKSKALIQEQNALLDTFPERYTLDQLGTTVKFGEKQATDNFVSSALAGLEELYTKTGNTEGLLKIQTLRETATDPLRGLTVRQLNDLAREYGRGFKAFSDSTGQPLTSVNAKLYETVRKGLKNVSRDLMPNDASKAIDEEVSNLITTEGLVKDMADKVQLLSNKVEMRSLGDRIGSLIGKVVNLASLGTAGGFVKGITPSDVGLKTLNSLRIQQNLPKNLAKLSKLVDQIDSLSADQIEASLKEIVGNLAEKAAQATGKAAIGAATNANQ